MLAPPQKTGKQQAGANNSYERKRVTADHLSTPPRLGAGDLCQMRRLANGVVPEVANVIAPILGTMTDLTREGSADAPDVTPHGMKLRFQAMRIVARKAELAENRVNGHGTLRVCRTTGEQGARFRALELAHANAI